MAQDPNQPNPDFPIPLIREEDLQDLKTGKPPKGLQHLNRVIGDIYRKLGALQGAAGPVSFPGQVLADGFQITGRVPLIATPGHLPDDNEVMTVGLGKQLFHPSVERIALTQGTWFGEPVQPLPLNAQVPSGGPSLVGGSVVTPPGTGCAVSTTFQGQQVCLSPFPFAENPISGAYLQSLYDFLNGIPGAWNYGCLNQFGYYWPVVDSLPISGNIPPDWGSYLIVGNKVIHNDFSCVP